MSIGSRIIQIRNQKDISQRMLGERSGLASSYLSRVENRRVEPGPKTLRKIADALGVPVSELFEEHPISDGQHCAVSVSGKCVMDMLANRKGKPPAHGMETYSPRQLQLLRMASYLIQTGNARLLDALELLLQALLAGSGGRHKGFIPVADLVKSPQGSAISNQRERTPPLPTR
ncbi:MAG TPA: helix-turn-helix transcriptional regulator [Terriglobia bacterium]|nr:helix-turn-helix transcriptional regulator [Terriglobia bacterium]